MTTSKPAIALDVGHKRIGVAVAHGGVRLAQPLTTVEVDGHEIDKIVQIYQDEGAQVCVVGLPRNLDGQETAQTEFTRQAVKQIEDRGIKVVWQDESLTSVKATEILQKSQKPHQKTEVDAVAASLILQDYLEAN